MTYRHIRPGSWSVRRPGRWHSEYGPLRWSWYATVKSRALQRAHSKRLHARRRNR